MDYLSPSAIKLLSLAALRTSNLVDTGRGGRPLRTREDALSIAGRVAGLSRRHHIGLQIASALVAGEDYSNDVVDFLISTVGVWPLSDGLNAQLPTHGDKHALAAAVLGACTSTVLTRLERGAKRVKCGTCKGKGYLNNEHEDKTRPIKTCSMCDGRGFIMQNRTPSHTSLTRNINCLFLKDAHISIDPEQDNVQNAPLSNYLTRTYVVPYYDQIERQLISCLTLADHAISERMFEERSADSC